MHQISPVRDNRHQCVRGLAAPLSISGSYIRKFGRRRSRAGLPNDGLAAILDHLAVHATAGDAGLADEAHSALPSTNHRADRLPRYPAEALVRLYNERWEIESAYLVLRQASGRRQASRPVGVSRATR